MARTKVGTLRDAFGSGQRSISQGINSVAGSTVGNTDDNIDTARNVVQPSGDDNSIDSTNSSDADFAGGDDRGLDPESLATGEAERTPTGRIKRKYGKRGTGNSGGGNSGREKTSSTTAAIAKTLQGIHILAAAMIDPVFRLTDTEAFDYASAVKTLSDLYDVPLPDEKIMAWIGLGMTLSKVYAPRVMALNIKNKRKKMGAVQPIKPQQQKEVDFTEDAAKVDSIVQ